MGRVDDVRDVGILDEVRRRLLVQYVETDELAEGDAKVGREGRDLGRGGDVGSRLIEQIVLAVARDHATGTVEHYVRVVQQESVARAIRLRTVDLLVVVHHDVHLELASRARDALQRLEIKIGLCYDGFGFY